MVANRRLRFSVSAFLRQNDDLQMRNVSYVGSLGMRTVTESMHALNASPDSDLKAEEIGLHN
jgi:hypothetical protein